MAQTSKEQAFGRLVVEYQSPLRRYLTRLTGGDRSRADDLAQETFIRAYHALDRLRDTGRFRAWLFRIAYRQFLDSCRGSVRPTIELSSVAAGQGPSQEQTTDVALLQTALQCLDQTERDAILLSALEGLSHGQIAHVMGLPLGSVKTVVARAKTKLRNYLKNEEV